MKTGALLFLLAVAASQVDLNLSRVTLQSGEADISECPIYFYGKKFTKVEVFFRPDSSFAVCFKNLPGETAQECLSLDNHGGADTVVEEKHLTQTNAGSQLHFYRPNFLTSSTCYVQLSLQYENVTYMIISLYNFDLQTAVRVQTSDAYPLDTVDVRTEIGDLIMGSWSSYDRDDTFNDFYVDISGCRKAGVPLLPGESINDPESCSVFHCSSSAQFSVGGCEPPEVCNGKTCVQPALVCTVTGSTVIDFFNRVHSVPDRCAYQLTNTSEIEIYAVFRERHLQDVPFLDHLIIFARSKYIYLEQGGRVRVEGQILTLGTMAQLFHGFVLSKDQTGVTVKTPSFKTIVYFDGNTAHVTGPDESLTGLCGNPTAEIQTFSPSASVASHFSPAGCEIQHSDALNNMVDCSHSTDLCNLMNEAPFTACHGHIDPEPYIAACTDTSCKYTPVDDLPCRYLEAYAEACFLKVDITVGDWRSKAGCSAALQASCLNQYCSDHEFCDEKLGEARCLCRALFASKYRSTDTLGEPPVCIQSSASITLAGCLLWDKGIDYSTLHLKDPDCTGHVDDQTHMVTFSVEGDACGTEVMMNDSHVIYKNKIIMRNSFWDETTRENQVEIDFSCSSTQPDTRSLSVRIKDSSVLQQIETGLRKYNLTMTAYTDAGFMHHVEDDTDIQMNQRIWLQMKTEGLDDDMVTVVTDCYWATNQPSPDGGLPYYLVIGGCPNPADQTVEMKGNGRGVFNSFSFHMFEYMGGNNEGKSEIYLHCKLELCPKGPGCAPDCSGGVSRMRRSSKPGYAKEGQALITMVWNN